MRGPGPPRTIVYVDGFNLYYGCLKDTPERWLDLGALCERLLGNVEIVGIKYFTARVKPRPDNPEQAQRQQTYLLVPRRAALNRKGRPEAASHLRRRSERRG